MNQEELEQILSQSRLRRILYSDRHKHWDLGFICVPTPEVSIPTTQDSLF